MLQDGDAMTAPTRWAAVVDVRDDRGLHCMQVGTYATAAEASAAARRAIIRLATPVAVEVAP